MTEKFSKHLEKYEIEEEIGKGDLTISYRARRKSDDSPILIKVVAPQFTFDTYFVSRFKNAIKRNIDLDHPNIVKTYEVGERGDLLFVARELIEGQTLAEYLAQNGPLPIAQTVDLVKQLAAALDYAHSKAIRHGNLTDNKVYIVDNHILIADFGIAHAMEETSLAKKGFGVGNPAYLSPERVKGESPSRTADLYALGILSYQMLTGQLPFSGEPTAVMHAQIYEPPQPPHELDPKIRPSVSQVILRMLSKGLELRHSTGAEFARALQMAAEGSAPIASLPVSQTKPLAPVVATPAGNNWRRFAIWLLIITPLVGCALAGGFWAINQWSLSQPQTTPTAVIVQNVATPVPTFSLATNTPSPLILEQATPTLLPTETATLAPPTSTPIPAPGTPVIAANSPFENLVLAYGISDNFEPVNPGYTFPPTEDPIYLFFDYKAISPGSSWGLEWKWDDVVLEETEETWPDDYGAFGTAWVYFSPPFGFEPGPYSISLKLDGEIVASASFIVQP